MRQSYGKGIRGVVLFRQLREAKNLLHARLNIGFFGVARPSNRKFDIRGFVFENPASMFNGTHHNDAASVGDLNRGFGVFAEEDLFDCNFGGLKFFDNRSKFATDLCEPLPHFLGRVSLDYAVVEVFYAVILRGTFPTAPKNL